MIYEFMATQDFNGYGKPWAPGENINQIDIPDGTFSNSGVTVEFKNGSAVMSGTSTAYHMKRISLGEEMILDPAAVSVKFFNPKALSSVAIYFRKGTTTIASTTLSDVNKTFTSWGPADDYTIDEIGVEVRGSNIDVSGISFSILVYDKTLDPVPSAFSPYANICPPEGFNIWDPTTQEYVQVYAGYVNSNTRELYLRPVYKEYAGEELVGPWMSSMDEYSEEATPTTGAFVIDFGGELTSFEITPFMLQTLLESLGIRQHFTDGAGLLNSLMDQAQGRVRSEEELLHLSRPLKVIPIGDQLPAGLTFKPISKDVLPGLPGKFIR